MYVRANDCVVWLFVLTWFGVVFGFGFLLLAFFTGFDVDALGDGIRL